MKNYNKIIISDLIQNQALKFFCAFQENEVNELFFLKKK